MKKSDVRLSKQNITLNIEGQFLSQRVLQLQNQLAKYKHNVNESVDRRVKRIVQQINTDKDIQIEKRVEFEKRKNTRLINMNRNRGDLGDDDEKRDIVNNHYYYNVEYNSGNSNEKNINTSSNSKNNKNNNDSNEQYMNNMSNNKNNSKKNSGQYNQCYSQCKQNNPTKNLSLFSKLSKKTSLTKTGFNKQNNINNNIAGQSFSNSTQSQLKTCSIPPPYTINILQTSRNNPNTRINSSPNLLQSHQQRHCLNCSLLQKQLAEKNYQIYQLKSMIEELKNKCCGLFKQYQIVKEEYQLFREDVHNNSSQMNQMNHNHQMNSNNQMSLQNNNSQLNNNINKQNKQTYFLTPVSHYKNIKKHNNKQNMYLQQQYEPSNNKQQKMLQQINNIMNDISLTRKIKQQKKSRISYNHNNNHQNHINIQNNHNSSNNSSRISQYNNSNRLDNSVFTIKEGVNRYGNNNGFF